ncbi:hypothetical protein Cflav_PD6267 [Pedosphaera parvula Ellin514]|uniref:Uncharacterized protein n=1 Tax=Pedosphaera parvula (strain Ellin514) TaxID=320771 RepID=B9XHU8_PEDPL|nr:hypothetical protein Cflav_PD6267 [Pedosphaera parvula Ellin514]
MVCLRDFVCWLGDKICKGCCQKVECGLLHCMHCHDGAQFLAMRQEQKVNRARSRVLDRLETATAKADTSNVSKTSSP